MLVEIDGVQGLMPGTAYRVVLLALQPYADRC